MGVVGPPGGVPEKGARGKWKQPVADATARKVSPDFSRTAMAGLKPIITVVSKQRSKGLTSAAHRRQALRSGRLFILAFSDPFLPGQLGLKKTDAVSAQKQACPGQRAAEPSSSSIRSRRLYFATRSLRLGAPVLICPAPIATARSAMVVSSVSPERWETTAV